MSPFSSRIELRNGLFGGRRGEADARSRRTSRPQRRETKNSRARRHRRPDRTTTDQLGIEAPIAAWRAGILANHSGRSAASALRLHGIGGDRLWGSHAHGIRVTRLSASNRNSGRCGRDGCRLSPAGTNDRGVSMAFAVGKRVVAESESTNRRPRAGVVEEVLRGDPSPRYRIR
jgi:hypothetical protein